jgi:hypothetical protein
VALRAAGAASDGGIVTSDGGLPSCGGDCCSRACAPYRTGVLVCQPPSGCRPTGEVCRTDADCCGFRGQQGVTGVGNCSKANPTDAVGRCDNGNACRPAGAVCKLATTSCNAENNCCSGNVNQNPFVCQQDILGIPRCTLAGESCADAGSQGRPGVCDERGLLRVAVRSQSVVQHRVRRRGSALHLRRYLRASRRHVHDRCRLLPGLPCVATPGSTRGTCGDRPSSDAGIPDGATPAPSDADMADQSVSDAAPDLRLMRGLWSNLHRVRRLLQWNPVHGGTMRRHHPLSHAHSVASSRSSMMLALLLTSAGCGDSSSAAPPQVGSSCETAVQCYDGLDAGGLSGQVTCLSQVSGGYCTHTCTADTDCCTLAGECSDGRPSCAVPSNRQARNIVS